MRSTEKIKEPIVCFGVSPMIGVKFQYPAATVGILQDYALLGFHRWIPRSGADRP